MEDQLIEDIDLLRGFADYPPVMTTAQVAEMLAINVQEVRRLCRERRIPSRRIGKAYRFFRDEVVAWLNSSVDR